MGRSARRRDKRPNATQHKSDSSFIGAGAPRGYTPGMARSRRARAPRGGLEGRFVQSRGRLLAIGGAEDRRGECRILREFVRLSERGLIVIVTVASRLRGIGAEYSRLFRRLGSGPVHVVDVLDRQGAHSKRAAEEIAKASAVFFTGGNQVALTTLIGGTEMDELLHRRHREGLLIAGTSAGAAMMSQTMITQGESTSPPRPGAVGLTPGLEFLLGTVIDTHFSQRGRHGRLLTALAGCPHDLGIGLDEDTAILAQDGRFEVLGSGVATVFDAGAASYSNVHAMDPGEAIALHDVRLHVLSAGHRFDIGRRAPIAEPEAALQKRGRR